MGCNVGSVSVSICVHLSMVLGSSSHVILCSNGNRCRSWQSGRGLHGSCGILCQRSNLILHEQCKKSSCGGWNMTVNGPYVCWIYNSWYNWHQI